MAIDHGLEGRNSEKSRQRRERKSRRLKKLVQATLKQGDAGGRRGEVKFDETARQAWLGGFCNRKQDRRKFGLTMQRLKDEKTRKEAKKAKVLTLTNLHKEDEKGLALRTKKQQRRSKKFGEDADEAKLSKGASGEEDGDEEGSDEEGSDEEGSEEEDEQQNVFDDEATMNMFGGEVSVVVDANPVAGQFRTDEEIFGPKSGEGGDSDNDDAGSIQSYRSRASQQGRQQHQPSRFERAMKKVKATLGTKKKNKAKEMKGKARSLRKKVESKMLYEKALGRKMKRTKGR